MGSIFRTILIGAFILLVGLGIVMWLSRVLTRPIRQTAKVAGSIAALDFDGVDPLPENRFREIDDLATAFNSMLIGLKSFGRYVPRHLVRQLIREHRVGAGIEQRELTVMFTDIAGFTATCEGMTPPDVADFINEHLTLVSNCIEAEGGTIDKYIGDAVVAMFGAPLGDDEHAVSACRAALRCHAELARLRIGWQARGLPELHVRIGLNSGTAVVGNMGSNQRFDYTMIGDAVNLASRLEQATKELGVPVLVSADAIHASQRTVPGVASCGELTVRGREEPMEVFGFTDEVLVSRLYRDLRLISIGGGADEVMLQVIARGLFGKGVQGGARR